MGRVTELFALANMTAKERAKFAYGEGSTKFTHLAINRDLLKEVPIRKEEEQMSLF